MRVPDMNVVAEEVGRRDFMARALLSECVGYVRDDGKVIRIETDNPFVSTYFTEDLKRALSSAFVTCRLNDAEATVEITMKNNYKINN